MSPWEYRIISVAALDMASTALPTGAAVAHLNAHGGQGWEAVGMTTLGNECAVLMKRPVAQVRSSGGRV